MTQIEELLKQDGVAQSEALAQGLISSLALTEKMLEGIAALNPVLNCFIHVARESALEAARASDQRRQRGEALSPVDGLPVAVKDNIDVQGMPTTAGLGKVLRNPTADAAVVAKLRQAGAIIVGKLNMDEAALGTTNANPHHGKCGNPWSVNYVPGGSSGGSGSAVAAGLVTMALGTDTMGSVRIPAACCGVTGFKPSAGRISNAGSVSCCRRMDTIGPLTRSVRDLDLWLPILEGYNSSDAWSRPYAGFKKNAADLSAAKIAVVNTFPDSIQMDADILAAYQRGKQLIQEAGASLLDCVVDVDFSAARRAGLVLVEGDLRVTYEELYEKQSPGVSPYLRSMMEWLSKQAAPVLAQADRQVDKAAEAQLKMLGEADALLLPTTAVATFEHAEKTPVSHADFTCLANMAGLPAVSIPAGLDVRGMPIGLQLVGPMGSDDRLVSLAKSLAELLDFFYAPSTYIA